MLEKFSLLRSPGNKGFLVVSRRVLEELFDEKYGSAHTEMEAYLYLLFVACYQNQGDLPQDLKRGELTCSYRDLSVRFGWSRRRVSRFFASLEEEGILTMCRQKKEIRVSLLHYDMMCQARLFRNSKGKRANVSDETFNVFWERYHELTQQPAVDIEATRRAWGKLTLFEREDAILNMEQYFVRLPSVDRARTALNYLLMKSFIMN